ncbi:hypothetical protein NDI37_25095 [Funiculus sociatus GB2-A5]|uniref:Uncharacterized protein n=1 Tax=Funiculus sociatus GB2-A5 TaxID=2933946 RepID=A0ABV0JWY7_9CYAN|nr:hypothetical protein [Trichocoleus sp. FACHB-832]
MQTQRGFIFSSATGDATNVFWYRVERVVSDWCDRKQWLAQNEVSYNL